jgi:RNA polymerase sigma-70 factor, ECF subfamily
VALLPAAWIQPGDVESEAPATDEASLVARARRQDAEAFRAIFDLHAQSVFRFLVDLLGDGSAADEGTQETFVRAYDRLHSLRDSDRLLPWLLGIARNVSLEHRRANRRVVTLTSSDDEGDLAELTADAFTPESLLLGREELARVAGALALLSEGRRAALLLRFDHGLPYDEIARVLGWSLSKAKVEVHRARVQLRGALVDEKGGADA